MVACKNALPLLLGVAATRIASGTVLSADCKPSIVVERLCARLGEQAALLLAAQQEVQTLKRARDNNDDDDAPSPKRRRVAANLRAKLDEAEALLKRSQQETRNANKELRLLTAAHNQTTRQLEAARQTIATLSTVRVLYFSE